MSPRRRLTTAKCYFITAKCLFGISGLLLEHQRRSSRVNQMTCSALLCSVNRKRAPLFLYLPMYGYLLQVG